MLPDSVYSLPEPELFLLVLIVTGVVALAVHLLFLAHRFSPPPLTDLSPVLQTLCGTLLVLSVTFMANTVWQTEARAREAVNAEARSIRLIRTYMKALTTPAHDGLLRLLADYGRAVAAEWPDMEVAGGSPEAEARLAEIYDAVIKGLSEGDQNKVLQQRVLSGLDAVAQAREIRITIALNEAVSGGQWFSVGGMALLLFLVISICHARTARARAVALAVMSVAISLALYVILSHDRPFVGYLEISPDPIVEAAA